MVIKLLLGFLFASLVSFGQQTDRYMVLFKDKTATPFSIDKPEQFLSAKSIARRNRQNIPVLEEDLPPNASYVAGVKAVGAHVFYRTRWMNGVLAQIRKDSVAFIAALPFVSSVTLVAPGARLIGGRVKKVKNSKATRSVQATLPQITQLGLDVMHTAGYRGENMTVAVLDAGFPGVNTATPFQMLNASGRIKSTFNFVKNIADVYQSCSGCEHGTEVLSTMAAQSSGFEGGAYNADYMLFATEDASSEYRIEEYNWLFAAEMADSTGADIISTSLGYNQFDDETMDYTYSDLNGATTVSARAASLAATKGMVVVVAGGNEGSSSWHYITTPADATGVLACGSVTIGEQVSGFSSFGPSADGRVKPDVVALGSAVSVIEPSGNAATNSGTSFSCPLVASLVAGVWQAYPFLTSAQLTQVIRLSADHAHAIDYSFGYGLPTFSAVKRYIENSNTVSVYPNPADSNKVNVSFAYSVGETSIIFYDLAGRQLSSRTFVVSPQDNSIEYDITSLASGVYLIKVSNNMVSATLRLVRP